MKKLVLLSDIKESNVKLEKRILELVGKNKPKLGYIPSKSEKNRRFFSSSTEYFKNFGFQDFLYFDLDEEYRPSLLKELLECDAILLTGGNTFYFLNNIRSRGFLAILREYVKKGGVLIGFSAGSILMSETISIAEFIDENQIGIKDLKSINLVDIEFIPHWNQQKEKLNEYLLYSSGKSHSIFTCNDGDGIIVNDEKFEFFGYVNRIQNGKCNPV